LIEYGPQALRHIEDLRRHYEQLERIEALRALAAALAEAEREIETDPTSGLPAPRPYPQLAGPGQGWVKVGAIGSLKESRHSSRLLGCFSIRRTFLVESSAGNGVVWS
jgi:hypothetical protein